MRLLSRCSILCPPFLALVVALAGCSDKRSQRDAKDAGAPESDGSTDASTETGSDAAVDGGTDAATNPFAGCTPAADLPQPPSADLTVANSCGAAEACAGSLEGSFRPSASCVERDDLFARVYGVCASANFSQISPASISGQVEITADSIRWDVEAEAQATVYLPNNCSFCRCEDKEAELRAAGFEASCHRQCLPDCVCTVTARTRIEETSAYVQEGGALTLEDGRSFEVCASGDALALHETSAASGSLVMNLARIPADEPPPPEICDGLDNDGDGTIDVDPIDCPPCSTAGVCGEGVEATCEGAAGWRCVYASDAHEASETTCDGLDNDCDGATDEPIYCGEEMCDGIDNDGDGSTDESPVDAPPKCLSQGVCAGTQPTCQGKDGWACLYPSSYEAQETTCDDLDNDCDGAEDEPASCCEPLQCAAVSAECGSIDDGCGGTTECGNSCPQGTWCGGAGEPNACGCTPETGATSTRPAGGATQTSAAPADAWMNVTEILLEDASDPYFNTGAAFARLGGKAASPFLIANAFEHQLPPAAVIQGIEVEVKRSARDGGGNLRDHAVRLVKDGSVLSADRAKPAAWPADVYTFETYGGPTDLWGDTWTAADINDPHFGVAFSIAWSGTAGNDDGRIDYVRMNVYYEVPCP